jgi:hypothetical protein
MTEACDAVEDLIGRLGPDEGLGVAVGELDVAADRGFELPRTATQTTAELLLGQRREPALDEVNPRRAGRREVRWKRGWRASQR